MAWSFQIHQRPNYNPTAYDDDWEDIPNSGPIPKWAGGIVAPLSLWVYGIGRVIAGQATMPGNQASIELHGGNAVALGLASASLGLFLHCHYFWGNVFHLAAWAVLGKIVAMMAFIGSLGYLLVQVGVLGKM